MTNNAPKPMANPDIPKHENTKMNINTVNSTVTMTWFMPETMYNNPPQASLKVPDP